MGLREGGDETSIKPETNEIMFDVHGLGCGPTSGAWTTVLHPPFPKYNGFTSFCLFAGIHVGYLIWILEVLSAEIIQHLNTSDVVNSNSKLYHPGLGLIRGWIQQVIDCFNKFDGIAIKLEGNVIPNKTAEVKLAEKEILEIEQILFDKLNHRIFH
jgi:hypothetical protein